MKISLKSIVELLEIDDINSAAIVLDNIVTHKNILHIDCNLSILSDYLSDYLIKYPSNDNIIYVNYLKDNMFRLNLELDINSKYRDYKIRCLLDKS